MTKAATAVAAAAAAADVSCICRWANIAMWHNSKRCDVAEAQSAESEAKYFVWVRWCKFDM